MNSNINLHEIIFNYNICTNNFQNKKKVVKSTFLLYYNIKTENLELNKKKPHFSSTKSASFLAVVHLCH